MANRTLLVLLLNYAQNLRFKNLFLLAFGLFVLDLIIPDVIPFADEILLALVTLLLSRWKKEKTEPALKQKGTVIEGEIVDEEPDRK